MSAHHVRIGRRRAEAPAADVYAIPYRESADDGRTILHAGDHSPICADCGRGTLQWAEAGYVPWHRICDVCGSHWDLHPITWGPARSPEWRDDLVRWVQGRGEIPLDRAEPISDDCPHTWGDLADLCTAEHWATAERDADRMAGQVVVPGAWARRARFCER
jgi:hypothetical protein